MSLDIKRVKILRIVSNPDNGYFMSATGFTLKHIVPIVWSKAVPYNNGGELEVVSFEETIAIRFEGSAPEYEITLYPYIHHHSRLSIDPLHDLCA